MTGHNRKNIRMLASAFHIVGLLLIMEGLFMLISTIPSIYEIAINSRNYIIAMETKALKVLCFCSIITFTCGFMLYYFTKKQSILIDKRTGFLVVTLVWIVFSIFGSMPYILGGYITNITDAYFETMSGFTATGASILPNVEILPYGIGLWRILTEWIGGIGIIVIMLSLIPMVGGGGMALYSAEVTGPTKNKLSPRIKETSNILLTVYLSLTLIYIFSYHFAGMHWFDAICYGLTTASTGGLAPHNASAMDIAPHIQYMMIAFMTLSGTNLLFIYFIFKRKFKELKKSDELKAYIGLICIATIIIFCLTFSPSRGIESTIRESLFEVVSSITSTGLVACNYSNWQTGAVVILFMLMASGAMSGSTTGGIKLVRVLILFKSARTNIRKSLHSNAFVPVTLDKKPIPDVMVFNVFTFFALYVIVACVGLFILIFTGVGFEEASISVISALGNMGPGYGTSFSGSFSHFTPLAKWTMSLLMCIGRLEFITVFSIFTKSFWRR